MSAITVPIRSPTVSKPRNNPNDPMNKNDNRSVSKLLPVLFGFFVMGFCDVVGISTSYVRHWS